MNRSHCLYCNNNNWVVYTYVFMYSMYHNYNFWFHPHYSVNTAVQQRVVRIRKRGSTAVQVRTSFAQFFHVEFHVENSPPTFYPRVLKYTCTKYIYTFYIHTFKCISMDGEDTATAAALQLPYVRDGTKKRSWGGYFCMDLCIA